MKTALQAALEEAKRRGADENHPVVKMLKAQETAEKSGKSSRDLYVTGSVKKG